MCGAIPPLPQYAFMAWCSVKAKGLLYLFINPELTGLACTSVYKMQKEILKQKCINIKKQNIRVYVCNA
jgi:hypothetical protein